MGRHNVDAYMDQFTSDMDDYEPISFEEWVEEMEQASISPVEYVNQPQELNEYGDTIPF